MRTPTRTSRIIGRSGGLIRPLLVAALAAGLVVAGSSAAQAQSITDADAAGDMVRFVDEAEEGRPAPNQVRNDVLRTTLTHSATRISIRVKYAELRRLGEGHGQFVQMVTNEELVGSSTCRYPRNWAGRTDMWRPSGDGEVQCAIRHSIDYTRNVIAVSFPRQCASSPPMGEVPCRRTKVRGRRRLHRRPASRDRPWYGETWPAQSRRVYCG